MSAPQTPIPLTRAAADYLGGRGVVDGRLDAELLLADVLGVDRLQLYLQYDRPLSVDEIDRYREAVRRRSRREPVQYITGSVAFRELDLRVDRRALIPRPETEVLVGTVLEWAAARAAAAPLRALDIGTGTGAIALSLLAEGPFAEVVATDVSVAALELAAENAAAVGLSDRLRLRRGSLFEPLEPGERFDALVSNPPYVAEAERSGLEPEVAEWEPAEALFAGTRGLDVIEPLVAGAGDRLVAGGLLALEVGAGQTEAVADRIAATDRFAETRVRNDLAGRPRIVTAVRE